MILHNFTMPGPITYMYIAHSFVFLSCNLDLLRTRLCILTAGLHTINKAYVAQSTRRHCLCLGQSVFVTASPAADINKQQFVGQAENGRENMFNTVTTIYHHIIILSASS